MGKNKWMKKLAAAVLAAVMTAATAMTALAASGGTISSVSIHITSRLEAGQTLPTIDIGEDANDGNVSVSVSGVRCHVSDAAWVTSTNRVMSVGDTPEMKIWLEADDDYYFKGTYRSSNVNIKNGTFVSATRHDSDTLLVRVKVKAIKGDFDAPESAYWKDNTKGTAKWIPADENDTGKYEVTLKKGGNTITTVETTSTSYNFYPYMTAAGTYTFKVRTIAKTSRQGEYGKKSSWTTSDEIYLAKEDVSDGTGQKNNNSSSKNNNTSAIPAPTSGVVNRSDANQAGWIQQNGYWFYRYPDGSYHKDGWLTVNDKRYLFQNDGKMLTGWQFRDGQYYLLNQNGEMVTGWADYNGKRYYLNPYPDQFIGCMFNSRMYTIDGADYYFNADGSMATGWHEIGDNWCYFYPETGKKAVSTFVNNFYVDENGFWRR